MTPECYTPKERGSSLETQHLKEIANCPNRVSAATHKTKLESERQPGIRPSVTMTTPIKTDHGSQSAVLPTASGCCAPSISRLTVRVCECR